jgi:hypothetical protein
MRLSHIPLRVTTGAYILNSGINKLGADDDTAKSLHQMACGAYPALESMEPQGFVRTLAMGEVAVGSALLLPFVPAWMAGALLTGFSGSLVGLYLRTPGVTKEDGVRPTQQGTPFAKDIWMVGSGLALLIDGLLPGRATRKAVRKAARAPARTAAEAKGAAKGMAKSAKGMAKSAKGAAKSAKGATGLLAGAVARH